MKRMGLPAGWAVAAAMLLVSVSTVMAATTVKEDGVKVKYKYYLVSRHLEDGEIPPRFQGAEIVGFVRGDGSKPTTNPRVRYYFRVPVEVEGRPVAGPPPAVRRGCCD